MKRGERKKKYGGETKLERYTGRRGRRLQPRLQICQAAEERLKCLACQRFFFVVFIYLSAGKKTMLLCDDWIHSLIY